MQRGVLYWKWLLAARVAANSCGGKLEWLAQRRVSSKAETRGIASHGKGMAGGGRTCRLGRVAVRPRRNEQTALIETWIESLSLPWGLVGMTYLTDLELPRQKCAGQLRSEPMEALPYSWLNWEVL